MRRKKICGIYCYENKINGKKYIGQSIDIDRRKVTHYLEQGKDGCKALQNAWNKYGKESFNFYILIQCVLDVDLLNKLEIFFIKYLRSHVSEWGYNLTLGGKGNSGYRHSDESKRKNSEWHKGKPSPRKGKKHTKEAIQRMSEAHMGQIAHNKGKKASDETRKKQSLAKIGKPASEESKLASSKKFKGIPKPKEQVEKMADSRRGVKNKKCTSKYIGVYYEKSKEKYRAHIVVDGKEISLGTFKYPLEAALAYNEAAQEFYGWKAKLNNISQEEVEFLWELD